MTPHYFRFAYIVLKKNGVVDSQREFTSMIGVGDQWLKCLGRLDRAQTRVREKTALRFRRRLDTFEQGAPRPLKPLFRDLLRRLDEAERIAALLQDGR